MYMYAQAWLTAVEADAMNLDEEGWESTGRCVECCTVGECINEGEDLYKIAWSIFFLYTRTYV